MHKFILNTYESIDEEPSIPENFKILNFFTKNILYHLRYSRKQQDEIETSFYRSLVSYFKSAPNIQKVTESFRKITKLKDIATMHIDFTKSNKLNESFLLMFGTAIKMILQRMFGQDVYLPDISVTGSPQQMKSFTTALASEKRYFDSYVRFGLNDPRTYKDRSKLQSSISQFERDTGIKWPFK